VPNPVIVSGCSLAALSYSVASATATGVAPSAVEQCHCGAAYAGLSCQVTILY